MSSLHINSNPREQTIRRCLCAPLQKVQSCSFSTTLEQTAHAQTDYQPRLRKLARANLGANAVLCCSDVLFIYVFIDLFIHSFMYLFYFNAAYLCEGRFAGAAKLRTDAGLHIPVRGGRHYHPRLQELFERIRISSVSGLNKIQAQTKYVWH